MDNVGHGSITCPLDRESVMRSLLACLVAVGLAALVAGCAEEKKTGSATPPPGAKVPELPKKAPGTPAGTDTPADDDKDGKPGTEVIEEEEVEIDVDKPGAEEGEEPGDEGEPDSGAEE
jgi:hypothetical protein